MDDSRISCKDELAATMDKPVSFVRPKRNPEDPKPEEPEPKPQIVALHGVRGVEVTSRKVDPDTGGFLELQRIKGDEVDYDRPTGNFQVNGKGYVYLYDLAEKPSGPIPDAPPPLTLLDDGPARRARRILRVARPTAGDPSPGRSPGPRSRPRSPRSRRPSPARSC